MAAPIAGVDHLYGGSMLDTELADGRRIKLAGDGYPWGGSIKVIMRRPRGRDISFLVLPHWANEATCPLIASRRVEAGAMPRFGEPGPAMSSS